MCISLATFLSFGAEIDYHKLLHQFPETLGRHGSWKQHEIEIAGDPDEIRRIETLNTQRLIRLGYPKEKAKTYSKIGVIAEDQYWIWIRDAVTFPGGIPGTYNRILMKGGISGTPGVIILPYLSSGEIVVNINFRHATRCWEMELPRGSRKQGEKSETAALRELREETGCRAKQLVRLGEVTPYTGVIAGVCDVYLGQVNEVKDRHQNDGEAIALNLKMTLQEIQEAYKKGYLITEIKGIKTKIYCRDPYLSYALMQAQLRKLI